VTSAKAQSLLEVTQAFYDAVLSDSLIEIARAALLQAEKTLEFARLGFSVGQLSEFEVLRAQVTRSNQIPEVTRRMAARDEAYLRLKQMLELPPETSLRLIADLASDELPLPEPFAGQFGKVNPLADIDARMPVRQAEAQVIAREAGVAIARSQRLPNINIVSQYGLVAYPEGFLPAARNQFRNNWTVGASLQLPILTFGRIEADEIVAESGLQQARAQRKQTRELALLDANVAMNQLRAAQEEWRASAGTVEQAQRAYEIAELRYREGISNLLELNDARIAFQQARASRAEAARNLQVSRVRVVLLPLLPLSIAPPGGALQPPRTPGQARPVLDQRPTQNPLSTVPGIQIPGQQTGAPGIPQR
jgi:outer membrane protein TolC